MTKSKQIATFIDEQKIFDVLEAGKEYTPSDVRQIITKAKELKGLELEELAALLWADDPDLEEEIFSYSETPSLAVAGEQRWLLPL